MPAAVSALLLEQGAVRSLGLMSSQARCVIVLCIRPKTPARAHALQGGPCDSSLTSSRGRRSTMKAVAALASDISVVQISNKADHPKPKP